MKATTEQQIAEKAEVAARADALNKVFAIFEKYGIEDGHVYDANDDSRKDTVTRLKRYRAVCKQIKAVIDGVE